MDLKGSYAASCCDHCSKVYLEASHQQCHPRVNMGANTGIIWIMQRGTSSAVLQMIQHWKEQLAIQAAIQRNPERLGK